MSTYVIGDVQGCCKALECLLDKINYDAKKDQLWFAGDLVNRGPDSLGALRLVKEVATNVVLGNHDLHLLACHYGTDIRPKRKDTIQDILTADDCDALMEWLCSQPLMIWKQDKSVAMSHAGIPHIWTLEQARAYSREVESVLTSDRRHAFFDAMYGNEPESWSDALTGMARLRVITNYLTRMRFVAPSGELEFRAKESVDRAPDGYQPWFAYKRPKKDRTSRIVFGHWAALNGHTGVEAMIATDTGCVWGGQLTAFKLKTGERIACDCA